MIAAGTAAFLQGKQRDVMGSGISLPGSEKVPPPEVDTYTVALWNADRTKLYDMQFTPQAIVRAWDRDLPKPYSRNFTHPYNSLIDFTKYRRILRAGADFGGHAVGRIRTRSTAPETRSRLLPP